MHYNELPVILHKRDDKSAAIQQCKPASPRSSLLLSTAREIIRNLPSLRHASLRHDLRSTQFAICLRHDLRSTQLIW
jgi:hypothetical protein